MINEQPDYTGLPFKPGDWVKVVDYPKHTNWIIKGDIIQVEQVSPSRKQIRISDPDCIWEYLNWSEIELTLPPKELPTWNYEQASLRNDKTEGARLHQKTALKIKELFMSLPASSRNDILEELLSSRNDTSKKTFLSSRNDKPRIVWRSPAKREEKYPWFEWGGGRVYIGGGCKSNSEAARRVAMVMKWIEQKVSPGVICDRIKRKQFNDGTDI